MARGTRCAHALVVHSALRVLLWLVAILAPGGFLLLPLLAAGALRKKLPPHHARDRAVQA
jgi:hypothetical protein